MFYRLIKRGFDFFSASLALIVLSPVFVIAIVGIKLSSPGPALYQSERIGLDGKPFTMLKFRSMHVKQENAVESKYMVNNARIFGFGSFLRKSKLDELPQLINVFLSDMSVVGPRPYPKEVVERVYPGECLSILSVKPGLACHDSLYDYAHGELFVTDEMKYEKEVVPVRTELAKLYVEHHSILTDVGIILRTVGMIWRILVLRKTVFPYNKIEREAVERVRVRAVEKSGSR